jgi:hypothetical protein
MTMTINKLMHRQIARPAGLVMMLLAASLMSGPADAAQGKRFVVLMLDETGSFTGYWQECLDYAAAIVHRLGPEDAFTLIGIDDHGFDPEDARIEITFVDPSPLKAVQQKRALAAKIKSLQRRPLKRNLTDIVGAIRQAALFSNSQKGFRPVLALFCDMNQTPRQPAPSDAAGIKFPAGAEAHCFYVNASGWMDKAATSGGKSWDTLVDRWISVFTPMGVRSGKGDYYQRGQARAAIGGIF